MKIGQTVQRQPQVGADVAARDPQPDHEPEGVLLAGLPALVAQVAVILLVVAVELQDLAGLVGDVRAAGRELLHERGAQVATGLLEVLDRRAAVLDVIGHWWDAHVLVGAGPVDIDEDGIAGRAGDGHGGWLLSWWTADARDRGARTARGEGGDGWIRETSDEPGSRRSWVCEAGRRSASGDRL